MYHCSDSGPLLWPFFWMPFWGRRFPDADIVRSLAKFNVDSCHWRDELVWPIGLPALSIQLSLSRCIFLKQCGMFNAGITRLGELSVERAVSDLAADAGSDRLYEGIS